MGELLMDGDIRAAGDRRRLAVMLLGPCLLLAVPAMLAVGTRASGGVSGALRDPLSMFSSRSPGSRPAGAISIKVPRSIPFHRGVRPARHARVVTSPIALPFAPTGIDGTLPFDGALPDVPVDLSGLSPSLPGAYPGLPFAGGPGSYLGGGGGGPLYPPGSGSGPAAPPSTTPVAPVPEPSTWAMMLMGFGIVGTALRRGSRLRTIPA